MWIENIEIYMFVYSNVTLSVNRYPFPIYVPKYIETLTIRLNLV